ncbi:MAG: NAD(P)-binding domain-containing protein [Candidatus Kaiserbacteria bacterium]|nr:NAD(P)-binding domain-containing protein [Candidatus Kaiserbacteria bacterium]
MKAVFFEVSEEDEKILRGLMPGIDAVFSKERLWQGNASLASGAEVISVFINSEVRKDVIDALPNLKFITTRSMGYDHIDVEYAKSKNIAVASVPCYGANTVAEFTFALILALSRKIIPAYHHLREYDSFALKDLMGMDLHGKTIGVVGTGKIGRNTINVAKGFGMNILAFDRTPDADLASNMGVEYSALPGLLSRADIVTIHVPYSADTHHLINKENVKGMKRGVLLINTARGEIVETEALVWGLAEGIIAGAGLDVLEGERYMKEEAGFLINNREEAMETKEGFRTILESHALVHDKRVIATPHMAFFSKEAMEDILKTTAENINGFASGTPKNVID